MSILDLLIHTIILYFHLAIQLHAQIILHIHNFCDSNVIVLTVPISSRLRLVANHFSMRQFSKHITELANNNVQSIHREIISHSSSKKDCIDRISSILRFHLSIYPLRIPKNYKTPMIDQCTEDTYTLLSITSCKHRRNLSSQSIHASHPQQPISSHAGTYSCIRRHYNILLPVGNNSATPRMFLTIFKLTETSTCISKDIA